jgi:hypothetical protein
MAVISPRSNSIRVIGRSFHLAGMRGVRHALLIETAG